MKFELNEDAVLRLNGAAMVTLGASVVACPRAHADQAFTLSAGYSEPMLRNFGAAVGWLGAEQLVLSARNHSQAAKKDLLKVAGFGWLAASAASLSNLKNNYQPREVVYTSIAAQAVLAGLSLWKGFE
ncbi:hypothetical protein ABPG77_006710 [Micractinium sp. CCAP 211/92]